MKILLVSHRYPPERGGVETWTQDLATGLRELGHEVAILTRSPGTSSELPPFSVVETREDGIPIHRLIHDLAQARSFRETWADERFRLPIHSVLDSVRPDLVHVAHPDGWGVLPFRCAGSRGIPTAATLHDYKWICARGQMVRPPGTRCERAEEEACTRCVRGQLSQHPGRLLWRRSAPARLRKALGTFDRVLAPGDDDSPSRHERALWQKRQTALLAALRDAHLVTSPSRFVARRFEDHGLDREILVIPNGSGNEAARPNNRAARRPGPLRLGFFGNAHQTKGLDLLLSAFEALPSGSAELFLHGPSLEDLGRPLPVGAVARGPYTPDTQAQLLGPLDLVAIPSTWDENQPLVALEARRAGKPLVVAGLGGLPELVNHEKDGWVVDADSAEAWGEQLALLASQPQAVARASSRAQPPRSVGDVARDFADAYGACLEVTQRLTQPGPLPENVV